MPKLFLGFALLAVALAGCTSNPSPQTPPTTPSPSTSASPFTVHATGQGDNNFFDPAALNVKVGQTVTWDVVGAAHHTVTFKEDPNGGAPAPDSGDLGGSKSYTFTKPGTYAYHCRYHSDGTHGMVGTITVS